MNQMPWNSSLLEFLNGDYIELTPEEEFRVSAVDKKHSRKSIMCCSKLAGTTVHERLIFKNAQSEIVLDDASLLTLSQLLTEVDNTFKCIIFKLNLKLENITSDDLVEIISQNAFDELTCKSILKHQKQRKLRALLQQNKLGFDALINKYVQSVIHSLPKPLVDEELRAFASKLINQPQTIKYRLAKNLFNVMSINNLKAYTYDTFSVNVSSKAIPKVTVYKNYVIDLHRINKRKFFTVMSVFNYFNNRDVLTQKLTKAVYLYFDEVAI